MPPRGGAPWAGAPRGGATQVGSNQYLYRGQVNPAVAMDAAGDFVVAWVSGVFSGPGQDGDSYGVYAQRYGAAGAPLGAEFRVNNIRTQLEINESQTVRERLLAMLALFFAVVALLLAGVGLYGVLHYSVLQRRHEIGKGIRDNGRWPALAAKE